MSTQNCYVDFWENKNYGSGGHHRFDGPTNVSDLSKDYWDGKNHNVFNEMDDCISSLKTGSQAWVRLYSQHNYSGSTHLVNPNTNIPDLSSIGLDNTVVSFKLFDAKPVDTDRVLQNFLALYPGATSVNKVSGPCIEFYTQNTHYRIYNPSISQDGDVVNFEIKLDHIIGGAHDDHATVTFAMDTAGNFVDQIKITYDMSSGAYQVPQWLLNFIDDGIDEAAEEAIAYLDGAEIVLTAGLGTELVIPTDILVLAGAELLTIGVNHINAVMSKLFDLSDNGGTMYFSAMIANAIARLMYGYFQERYAADSGNLVTFDKNGYANSFGKSWSSGLLNEHFSFHNNGNEYRSFLPDSTAGYSKAGMVTSVKIDAINDMAKDDYLVLFTTFDPTGKLFSVQGNIDIYGAPSDGDTSDYTAPSSGTIAYNNEGQIVQITNSAVNILNYSTLEDAFKAEMQNALNNVQHVDHSNFSDGLNNFVNAAAQALEGLKAAVSS